ncbi:MAG: monovalent cation/H(+) antiporter subunit G [Turicibacter sp.]|nr:monovalent cation/H(+) antiporter subunit G [Turicibacter sp.]
MIQEIIGNILIGISVLFVFVGLIGVFRFHDFYAKVLASSKIDTAATITLILGLAVRGGFSWFTAKALMLLLFCLFINPVNTSKIIQSARLDEQRKKGGNSRGN